jgi:CMP/dCMP kinase
VSRTTLDEAPSPEELVRVVALDGPAGSGKSSVSRAVAKELGWRFVDTGATYRAVTLAVLRRGIELHDEQGVLDVAKGLALELGPDPDLPLVLLDGEDVTQQIRSPEVTAAVSAVSSLPAVRELLVRWQRALVGREAAVVEGRDIATVVAPRAAVKVYLDARPEVRAQRRAAELPPGAGAGPVTAVGAPSTLHDDVQAALAARDARDNQTNRLVPADGAVHLETSDLTFAEVVAEVISLVHERDLAGPTADRTLDRTVDRTLDRTVDRTVERAAHPADLDDRAGDRDPRAEDRVRRTTTSRTPASSEDLS